MKKKPEDADANAECDYGDCAPCTVGVAHLPADSDAPSMRLYSNSIAVISPRKTATTAHAQAIHGRSRANRVTASS